jgi:hypothetical protein
MPPEGYTFWDQLMWEQGVTVVDEGPDWVTYEVSAQPNYNVGDVIVGEIVEDE